ncbi:COP9 signalosome complex subunit CsnE [Cryomyces antarcticus]|nr:COP9 signalosome catalytic subunit rri1 [Oleoguttula sp. CCFEE 6159]
MDSARVTWELDNAVRLVDPTRDALYGYDVAEQKKINAARPWKTDPHHFKHVRISAVALIKMVMHARSGGSLEIMGLMQGSVHGDTFIVTDALRLPVEGTETRVNAQDEANEYMVKYLQQAREVGQLENAVGWYHSHPGYGCWLSGIDVGTQATQQMYSDPFLAVVIDPDRTISAGKVEIGAFRTFPEDYKKPDRSSSNGGGAGGGGADENGWQTIPSGKMEDFGAHANRYYALEVSHFKSTLDSKLLEALWNKYWVNTLAASPVFTNRDYGTKQIEDLAYKIKAAETGARNHGTGAQGRYANGKDVVYEKLVRASERIKAEETTGLMATGVKGSVFGGGVAAHGNRTGATDQP